jgi:Spy/CpxP family protein refolding chaperone
MCGTVLLGVMGGALAAKLFMHRRRFRGRFHGRPRFGGPGRLFWLMRELELDRRQKREIWQVVSDVRHAIGELRFGKLQSLDVVADAIASETFDRATVEAEAARQGDVFAQARARVIAALERIHAILTPEQRERLRFILSGEREVSDPGGPDGGPYRAPA